VPKPLYRVPGNGGGGHGMAIRLVGARTLCLNPMPKPYAQALCLNPLPKPYA